MAIALIVPFHELGGFRTLGSHEAYAVVPAKEMLETGDWIVPRYSGLPRLQKPPLGYWLVAASGRMFGGVNELTARLPAALAAVALAALMGFWATRWYGREAGYWAALAQLTAVWAIDFGRKAEVDMVLCLATTAAMFLIASEIDDESPARADRDGPLRVMFSPRWTAIYALLAIAWLAKFHYAAAMVCAPVAAFWLIERRWRNFVKFFNPLGLTLLAVAAGIWPWLVWRSVPDALAVWKAETIGRAVGALDVEPAWFYLPHLVGMALPWSLFALAIIPRSWRAAWNRGDSRERFLWVWLIAQNLLLAAQASKHKHYLMACLPILSLWAARALAWQAERARRGEVVIGRRSAAAGIVACLAGSALAAALLVRKWPDLVDEAVAICAIFGAGSAATLASLRVKRHAAAGAVACGFALACYIGAVGWIVPARDPGRAEAEFVRAAGSDASEERPLCLYRLGMSPLVFYADAPIVRIESAEDLRRRLEGGEPLSIVARRHLLKDLRAAGESTVVREFEVRPDELDPNEPPFVHVRLRARAPRVADRTGAPREVGGR